MIQLNISKQLHGSNGKMELNIKLEIQKGAFVALAGESGSGKTTLLRIVAGLEEAEGMIVVDDEVWLDGKKALSPQKRGIGFVFQDYALFPNMTVEENLLFVEKDRLLADELLVLTELSELRKRLPSTLSGGQKQRVALCRAFMKRPKILLMDEPLSALNPEMRTKLQTEILMLHKKFGTTIIMVSHDPSEIYKLAEQVLILEQGKILKNGTPKEIYLKGVDEKKFTFDGELLEFIEKKNLYFALVSLGEELIEVPLSQQETEILKIGDRVQIGSREFSPTIFY